MLYAFVKIVFAVFFKILFRARVIGRENFPKEGAVILAANHMSNWDPPFLATFAPRPVSYMAKIELFKNPVFGAMIRAMHAFPVKRGAADRGAIKTAMQVLKEKRVLGLFPEGTRHHEGQTKKAESGVALIASMAKAPVVPAAILGTDCVFNKGKLLPRLTVVYGEPMYFEGDRKNKEELEAFSQKILDKIYEMKNNVC